MGGKWEIPIVQSPIFPIFLEVEGGHLGQRWVGGPCLQTESLLERLRARGPSLGPQFQQKKVGSIPSPPTHPPKEPPVLMDVHARMRMPKGIRGLLYGTLHSHPPSPSDNACPWSKLCMFPRVAVCILEAGG